MKKRIFIALAILLISLQFASAIEVNMKPQFAQGETLLAKISGNFIDQITKDKVFFYRGAARVSFNFDIAKINDEFYIYAQTLGKSENNYSIKIKDVRYMKGREIISDEIILNFSITNTTADFYISDGFIITKGDFQITVQNLQDYKLTVYKNARQISEESDGGFFALFSENNSSRIQESEEEFILKSGEIKKIDFSLNNISEAGLYSAALSSEKSSYEIPVYVSEIENLSEEINETKKGFRFKPLEINITLATNSNSTRIIFLHNTENSALENITIYLSESLKNYINISLTQIEELEGNSSVKIKLFFSSDEEEKNLEGQISAKTSDNLSEELYAHSAVFLNFIRDYIPLNETDETQIISSTLTCGEMNGTICDLDNDEECSGDSEYAKDGVCCLAGCEKIKQSSGAGKIIGWIIVIAVILYLVWFFLAKYRKVGRDINLAKIGRKAFGKK